MKRLTIREVQLALLELLTEFDKICKKHGLRYSLSAGTLLGAVRHKGFIPWDDDADVCMPRPDYEKFVKIISQEGELPEYLSYSKDRGKGAYYPFAKLLDKRYELRTSNHVEVKYLYIDIFPIDGSADTEEERRAQFKKEYTWQVCTGINQWYTMDRWWGVIAYIIGFWFYIGFSVFVPKRHCIKKLNAYAQKYEFGKTEWAGCHNYGYVNEHVPTRVYENFCELEFEGRKLMAVSDYDLLLTNTYGNYMQPPPPNKQRSRHYMRIYKKD